MADLNKELLFIKEQMLCLEEDLITDLRELDYIGDKWFKLDQIRDELIDKHKDLDNCGMFYLNIGGRKFQASLELMLSMKDTIFYNLITTGRIDYTKELFIDRSPTYFPFILSYLRNKSVCINSLSNIQIQELYDDAVFYEIKGLEDELEVMKETVYFTEFEFSGAYSSGSQTAGTNNINDINLLQLAPFI